MATIQLERELWAFDDHDPIGPPGGFGAVFKGWSGDGKEVALKRINVIDGDTSGVRESKMAETLSRNPPSKFIVPFLDWGKDPDSGQYYIVMPKADFSLQDYLVRSGPMPELAAAEILLQIVLGLIDAGQVIHRDIKPANVLYYEKSWRIADFGVARFIAEATASRTLASNFTFDYAAPEQFEGAELTHATDIYAVGCVAYSLITGSPPFSGEDFEIAKQHRQTLPKPLTGVAVGFENIIRPMLRKRPEVRLTLDRAKSLLESFLAAPTKPKRAGALALESAAAFIAAQQSAVDAEAARLAELESNRKEYKADAIRALEIIFRNLDSQLRALCPEIVQVETGLLKLAGAHIEYSIHDGPSVQVGPLPRSGWDVIASGAIKVSQAGEPQVATSSNLLYVKVAGSKEFRWYECAFAEPPENSPHNPFARIPIDRSLQELDSILSHDHNVTTRLAFAPEIVDVENEAFFIDRWCFIFALACRGWMPERHLSFPLAPNYWQGLYTRMMERDGEQASPPPAPPKAKGAFLAEERAQLLSIAKGVDLGITIDETPNEQEGHPSPSWILRKGFATHRLKVLYPELLHSAASRLSVEMELRKWLANDSRAAS